MTIRSFIVNATRATAATVGSGGAAATTTATTTNTVVAAVAAATCNTVAICIRVAFLAFGFFLF